MKSLTLLKVISVLPRNWNSDAMFRYSKPLLRVCFPRVQVTASLNDSERGSNSEPIVDEALVARISNPLRAMPVVPRASIDDDVKVPLRETPTGSYPGGPNAVALV